MGGMFEHIWDWEYYLVLDVSGQWRYLRVAHSLPRPKARGMLVRLYPSSIVVKEELTFWVHQGFGKCDMSTIDN